MAQYKIADYIVAAEDPGFERLLATIYDSDQRPLCLCRGTPGIEMYVAHVGDHYIIKRMPYSGVEHAPDCISYDPPLELTGLGEVLGSAIQENAETGTTTLKFDFSLSK